jgi:hypothetical protein
MIGILFLGSATENSNTGPTSPCRPSVERLNQLPERAGWSRISVPPEKIFDNVVSCQPKSTICFSEVYEITMKGSLFTFAGWVIQETLESPKFVHFLKLSGGFGSTERIAPCII